MAELKSKLDELRERKEKSGQFRVVERSEVYTIYRTIDEEMKKFDENQRKQEKKSVEYASKLILK
jgi:hypothetical protein